MDQHGRILNLRGLNVSGASKLVSRCSRSCVVLRNPAHAKMITRPTLFYVAP